MTSENKKIIPIAFAFDENLIVPAEVCISSLLSSAKPDTFYDIFILHADGTDLSTFEAEKLKSAYGNCNITLRSVGNAFSSAFEIRGITVPAYYRLLIPELIPEHDKIVYSDVDVVFRSDLWELYSTNIGNAYIGATYDMGLCLSKDGNEYTKSVDGLCPGEYIQSGFILINSKQIRQDKLTTKFKELAKLKLRYQDQDILNIACNGRIHILPYMYNMTDQATYYLMNEPQRIDGKYNNSDSSAAKRYGTVHFNGHKPWKKYSVYFDIWWEAYRKSPVFDEKYYFDFFYKKIDEYDRLPLMKRIKILVRYFVHGRKK